MTIMASIIPLIATAIAAALGYLFGRRLETSKQLTLQKGQAYADFLKALANAATNARSNENLALAADAKTRICIYGSSSVISHLAKFERTGAKVVGGESRAVISGLVTAMRSDMSVVGDRVSEADLHDTLFGPVTFNQ